LCAGYFLIQATSGLAAESAVPTRFAPPTVFIHYYDWYGAPPISPTYGHWDGGNRKRADPSLNITSASYPLLGPYDSSSASVVRQHMAWIKAAHVDVVSLNWFGQGSLEDRVAKTVMDGAAAQGLRVNFVINPYSGETVASIGSDIAYIYRKYGSHRAFYRVARPTKYGPSTRARGLFMLYSPPPPLQYYSEYSKLMDQIRGTANDAIVLLRTDDRLLYSDTSLRQYLSYLHVDGMFNYGVYGTTEYQRQLPQSNDFILMFSVGPGFDNSRAAGITNPVRIARANGNRYDGGWSALISRRPEWISVVSFNEWHETSQIEPARPFSYGGFRYLDYEGAYGLHGTSAYTAYLTRTALWADRFKGKVAQPSVTPSAAKTSPPRRPTGTPSEAPLATSPRPLPEIPRLALILVVVGGLVAAAVVLWRRRR
jgi:glycoprotein endo-alpha-1,2-mannosidase